MKRAVLIAFSIKTEKFRSNYEKTLFFKHLYGWKQVIKTKYKKYEYKRPGLLNKISHIKVDQSSFIVPEEEVNKILEFFEQWSRKIIYKTFKILLEEDLKW